jgi:polyketide synthase PksJ
VVGGPTDDGEDSLLDVGTRLRQFLQQRLPDYMVPSSFVILEADAARSTGKLDLSKLARSRQRGQAAGRAARHGPTTTLEETIAAVWADVLNRSDVDRRDNFFDIGGDSLLISQVRATLERELSRHISIIDLFRYPTVSSLGAFLGNGSAHPAIGSTKGGD